MDIFQRMRQGEWINRLTDEDYQTTAAEEMARSRKLCFQLNQTQPGDPKAAQLLNQLFEGRLPQSSVILTPLQIDRAKTMTIGKNVFINHGLTCMSSGGITIEDGVMIGPEAALITANHDFKNLDILQFKPIHIKKGAWIGARSIILPGITVGEGAVVASGAVVTRDVPDKTVVGGSPARKIKTID
ncbi:DapH/DapD/GlmU-related protein [Streptococcus chenjunshii]|nr:DapH/DapD/GlmU-related protein [Streptococcus chenjunshii]